MSRFASHGFGRIWRHTRRRTEIWFSILLFVCSYGLAGTDNSPISADELLEGTALGLGADPPTMVSSDEVMALSKAMRQFLRAHVSDGAGNSFKLNQLIDAVISKGSFGLEYDETTRTAAETFRAKRGNCLSFTYMFLVLARGVGLDARFQEVDIPPAWTFANETYILNRHINIYFDLGMDDEQIVDFNVGDFKTEYDMRIISDQRALAHFFNNLGAELMQQGNMKAAFHAFRRAITENDWDFSPAWTNLGTLYRRKGLGYHAEAAYIQAIEIDKSDLNAMSNLTSLYDQRGDPEQAARYRNKVDSHRQHNPYYRYQLARDAIFAKDYDLAIDHLKYAARKYKNEDRFRFLLGLVYLQTGDEKKARRWMARAEKLADNDALRNIYSSKIDRLISASR
jgi:Flp pilus assembly protein TadD